MAGSFTQGGFSSFTPWGFLPSLPKKRAIKGLNFEVEKERHIISLFKK